MKRCPYCAEEIQDAAIKCRYCHEFLDGSARPPPPSAAAAPALESLPWYHRTTGIVIAICCVGPLALPLVWWHPRLRPVWKVAVTLAVAVLTWFAYVVTAQALRQVQGLYQMLDSTMKP